MDFFIITFYGDQIRDGKAEILFQHSQNIAEKKRK